MQVISALVLGGHWPKKVHLPSFVYWYSLHLCSGTRESISQSRFICQVVCIGIRVMSPLVMGGLLDKVGSSAKFCVLVFMESLLCYQGGPSAKVGSSAKLCVLVFKSSQLWYWGDFWSSKNNRKPLSKQKCVLRKCSAVSQKWWMLELSNLCHYVQHPWKLTNRDFWRSRNTRKPLIEAKTCFEKMQCSISEMVNARSFKPLPLCSAPLKTY